MDHYSSSSSSQRGGRELQGPRPAPLKVRKDSHKIRKPPQQQSAPAPAPAPPVQVRQPVIIYTVSPKVVHANPSEFRSVVQRLTGARTAASASLQTAPPPTVPFPFQVQAGPHEGALQLSPAARLAAIEQARRRSHGGDAAAGLPPLPSILSPVPGLLPAIPASFFSPPAGGGINLLGELISPAFLDHRNYSLVGGTATFSGAGAPSPSPSGAGAGAGAYYWDLFNNNQQH